MDHEKAKTILQSLSGPESPVVEVFTRPAWIGSQLSAFSIHRDDWAKTEGYYWLVTEYEGDTYAVARQLAERLHEQREDGRRYVSTKTWRRVTPSGLEEIRPKSRGLR